MIIIDQVSKIYAKQKVVNNVSLEIKRGTIFGLLGPNGAGKTTLMRMLCGLVSNDGGKITINGDSVEDSKKSFGYVSQYFGQYEELSVWENILFYAQMYEVNDIKRLQKLLMRYHLDTYKDTKAGSLSGGYKRRLALVCALAHDPNILFLDEPTAGIDPVTRKLLWDDFYQLSQEGKTLFVTTHYMEEAERCEDLAFLAKGEIIAQGSPSTIKESLGTARLYTIELNYSPFITEALSSIEDIILLNQFGTQLRILVNEHCNINAINQLLKEKFTVDTSLVEGVPNLEDVFITLTKDSAL